jgi:DNA-binding Xre family transcriptional regulator
MRLRVPELLAERGMTAYAMHKASRSRISLSMAYRLAKGSFGLISAEVLDALCDIFDIADPGPLLTRSPKGRSGTKPGRSGRKP